MRNEEDKNVSEDMLRMVVAEAQVNYFWFTYIISMS